MDQQIRIVLLVLLFMPVTGVADAVDALEQQVERLAQQIQTLKEEIQRQQSDEAVSTDGDGSFVDLTPAQRTSIDDNKGSNVLSNPWWKNFDISGFGAVGFYDTGSAGPKDKGGFEIKEASLFISADVWDDVEFFVEFQTNRLGRDGDRYTRTGEVFVRFHDIALSESTSIGLKFGRIDVPFGEEYLWQDAFDNPLITNSAGWPYATDEGIAIYGNVREIGWIFSVTDGLLFRGREQNPDKAVNLKIHGQPFESLYLSFSAMNNGSTSVSAMQFAGSFLQPIGGFGHQSTLGTSASSEIDARLAEIDAKYEFSLFSYDANLALSYGSAKVDDDDAAFSRDFSWFFIEPLVRFNENWYAILRYSEIGTYDSNEGYHFDGKTLGGGNASFGYDTKKYQRLSLGLGWTPNPHVKAKLEFATNRFALIDASPLPTNNGDRHFLGLEIAVGF